MIPEIREQYNRLFSADRYRALLSDLNAQAGYTIPFRIAETPIFLPPEFMARLMTAGNEILSQLLSPEGLKQSLSAVPGHCAVPGDAGKPTMIALDFAVCYDQKGIAVPRLIEMQGFPSLFAYQHLLAESYRKHFEIAPGMRHLFTVSEEEYLTRLKKIIVGPYDPLEVVLLEIEPEKQNTYIDLLDTARRIGISVVCISEVIRDGKQLYYLRNGVKQPISRIYNRVIFDELQQRKDLNLMFQLTDEVEVDWVCHPDWFFRISKYMLPYLQSEFVPYTFFANAIDGIPVDLDEYVLKPLYSFSGQGVQLHVTKETIAGLSDPENYILQRKVEYAPVIVTPDGPAKVEIRVMYLWDETDAGPVPVITLARLSKGEMVGVKYNSNKEWVGSSVCFFNG